MLIDIHAHIWKGNYEYNKKEIIQACQRYKISKVYVSGLGEYYPDEEEIQELNQAVHIFMNESPDLIGGFCYINPLHPNCVDVLKQGIEEYGMSGMKLWVATYCDDPKVFPLVEKCIDYDIPILVHSFHKSVGQLEFETVGTNVAKLAKEYPESKIIMAHLGGNCYHGIKAIKDYSNVWVDISGTSFRRDELDYTKRQIGASRILFGTDMPSPGSFMINIGQVEEADLTDNEKQLIYYQNALTVLERN